jgi:hypothetical protein
VETQKQLRSWKTKTKMGGYIKIDLSEASHADIYFTELSQDGFILAVLTFQFPVSYSK